MTYNEVINKLESLKDSKPVSGMARYGINCEKAYGISMPDIRRIAKEIKRDNDIALKLWKSDIHEAKILACLIYNPKDVTEKMMEEWVKDFNSWDLCDQCCMNLFDKTPFAYDKALEWSERQEEFVKRAGFALMATLAVHDKKEIDERFLKFLRAIVKESTDERNFVKKAVNWALRQIGKRSIFLNKAAVKTAESILILDDKTAKWIAADALRELNNLKVIARLER